MFRGTGVLLAAHGRQAIALGRTASTRELAVLAAISETRVRQLVSTGELRRNADGGVRADDAKRCLATRGVAGYRA